MLISYNWLKELVDIDLSLKDLDHALTMIGIEVEGVIDYKSKYDKFFTAKVLTKEKHPDADKLSVCTVQYGEETKTVVCGAPNVDAGQTVVLGTEGAVVPAAGFTLVNRAIRNVKSEGMICSQTELELGEESDGIWVLPENAEPGLPLAEYLQLNDIILDVSITPNRPDWLSHIGVARELAAFTGAKYRLPEFEIKESDNPVGNSAEVIIEDAEKCPRFTARVIRGVDMINNKTPEWMKKKLLAVGMRPINLAADVTNYVMMEFNQPMHAYDLNDIAGNKIIVKTAKDGAKFTTLDEKEHKLDSQMLMICDAEKEVGIGGVMGGLNSEIKDTTKDILLEAAFFNPSSIRRTSKKLGIQSESSYRFERGADIDNIINASNRAAQLIAEYGGGYVEKGIIDVYPEPKEKFTCKLRYQRANDIIGLNLTPDEIKNMMTGLQFRLVDEDQESCTLEAPSFRVDMAQEIDLIEEVARMYNYEKIEPEYASFIDFGTLTVPEKLALPGLREELRKFLIPKGFKEILTQNQTDPESAAIFTDNPVTLANALGRELSIMRPSLVPSMLKTIIHNIRVGNHNLKLYEIGKSFHKVDDKQDTFIQNYYEKEELMIAFTGNTAPKFWDSTVAQSDFYSVKGVLQEMIEFFRIDGIKLKAQENIAYTKNSMGLFHKKALIGHIGEVSQKLLKKYDIEATVYLLNIDLKQFYALPRRDVKFTPVAPYPAMMRDLAFLVEDSVEAEKISNLIQQNGGKLLRNIEIFDVYKGKNIEKGKKSIAFKLTYSSPERTLVEEEVQKSVDKIVEAVEKKYSAQLRKF